MAEAQTPAGVTRCVKVVFAVLLLCASYGVCRGENGEWGAAIIFRIITCPTLALLCF